MPPVFQRHEFASDVANIEVGRPRRRQSFESEVGDK